MTIDRRKMIGGTAAGLGLAGLPFRFDGKELVQLDLGSTISMEEAAAESGGQPLVPWTNWSESQRSLPKVRIAPKSEAELQEIVASTSGTIRPVGAGHSFTALVPTDDTIVSLARLAGVNADERNPLHARIGAGTKLGAIGAPLAAVGQGLYNMPDIDQQSLAGATATGTHGTGADLAALHHYIHEMRLVTASGDILELSREKNPDYFDAARVNLGALGIVTEFTLRNRETYNLEKTTWTEPFEEVLGRLDDLARDYRNFEFYYIPFSDMCICIGHTITDKPVVPRPPNEDNEGVMTLKSVRDWLGWWPWLRKTVTRAVLEDTPMEYAVDEWWKIYPSERMVRFNEMEFHLPRDEAPKAIREIKETMERDNISVFFPFEFRFIDEDDAWISPFYRRKSCSIAIHRYYKEDRSEMFRAMEPIYRSHGGRPHWGKHNSLTGADVASLYPKWNDFLAVRRELDPDGKFLNPYLKGLMGA